MWNREGGRRVLWHAAQYYHRYLGTVAGLVQGVWSERPMQRREGGSLVEGVKQEVYVD